MVRRYEDLHCWRLAARGDFRFADQIRSSAASAPANLSEAFGYYRHGEASRHARIARASLLETHHHLNDGADRKHWTARQIQPLLRLCNRAITATTRWMRYLDESDAP